MGRAAPNHFLLDFTRSTDASAASVRLPEGEQEYQIRGREQTRPELAKLRWSPRLLELLDNLRDHTDTSVSETAARVGRVLADFVDVGCWHLAARELAARGQQERLFLTVRSNAAEMYLLPWELVALDTATHAAFQQKVLFRYEWPDTRTAPRLPGLSMTRRGRVVFAWSAAGGKVDATRHVRLIEKSIDATRGLDDEHDRALDVVDNASCESIRACLERARAAGEPVAALHLLCHGGCDDEGAFGLVLCDGSDPDARDLVSASRLQQLLAPYAGLVRLVVLSACDGGNAGPVGHELGSAAQALHRAGFGAVIASRFPLSWDGARVFATELYDQMLRELAPVEDALLAARAKLSRRAAYDWASLQFYAREADGDATSVFNLRPYRGLSAFAPEHARFYFGRETEVTEAVSDMEALVTGGRPRFLVLSGASGTGKSSLVMAGAIPRWRQTTADGRFDHISIRPGNDPMRALQLATARAEGAKSCLRFLVVVDQFEELFTHANGGVAERFVRALWEWATDPDGNVCVLLTLRVDFLARCNEFTLDDSGLRLDRVACDPAHQVLVAQMSPEQLRAAIERPAEAAGLRLEANLAELIVRDVEAEPGALPLMSHALYLLWLGRNDAVLTRAAYEKLGRVQGALNTHAETLLKTLRDDAEREAVRRLVVRLVYPGVGGQADTRRRRTVESLRPEDATEREHFERVLRVLTDARLLVTGGDGGAQTVEIAHEALIRNWQSLRAWLDAARARLAQLDQLDDWAQDWKKNPDALLAGSRLGYAEEVAAKGTKDFGPDARSLLEASRAERDRQQRQAELLRRARIVTTALAFAVVSAFAGVAGWQWRKAVKAQRDADTAQSREARAQHASRMASKDAEAARLRGETLALRVQGESQGFQLAELRAALRLGERAATDAVRAAGLRELLFEAAAEVRTRAMLAPHSAGVAFSHGLFSPDGTRALMLTEDRALNLWNAETGAWVRTLGVAENPVTRVVFSPEGRHVFTALRGGAMTLTDVEAGTTRRLNEGGAEVTSAAFSRDGARLLTTTNESRITVWSVRDEQRSVTLSAGTANRVSMAAFASDGHVVVAAVGRDLYWWPWESSRNYNIVPGSTWAIRRMAVASNVPRAAAVFADNRVQVWEQVGAAWRSRAMLAGHRRDVSDLALSPDGLYAATASVDGTARVWSVNNQTRLAELHPAGATAGERVDGVASVAFSMDGRAVLTRTRSGVVGVWSRDDGRLLAEYHDARGRLLDVRVADDGSRLRVLSDDGEYATVWRDGDEVVVRTRWGGAADRTRVALSADGRHVVSAAGAAVAVQDALAPRETVPFRATVEEGVDVVRFSGDAHRVVLGFRDGWVRVRDAENPGLPAMPGEALHFDGAVAVASVSSRGDLLAAGGVEGWVRVARRSDGRDPQAASVFGAPWLLGRHEGSVTGMRFSRDGSALVTASSDRTACVWSLREPVPQGDAAVDVCPLPLVRHAGAVNAATFSVDASRILTGSDDTTACLWNATKGTVLFCLRGHTAPVRDVAFSHDGLRLATASADGTFRLWDAQSGRSLATVPGSMGTVERVVFTDDDRQVVTVSGAGTVRVWTVDEAVVRGALEEVVRRTGATDEVVQAPATARP